jgi:hypothetical protein
MTANMTPPTSSSALNARPMPSNSSRSKTGSGREPAKRDGQVNRPTTRRLPDPCAEHRRSVYTGGSR